MIDYRASYALSLLLHVTVIGVLSLNPSVGDDSIAKVTQDAFSVQLLTDVSQVSPAAEGSMQESLEAVVVPETATAPVEPVVKTVTEPAAETAPEQAEPIDTPREEVSVVRIVAKTPQEDTFPARQSAHSATRVVAATLKTNFLDFGEPATASRNTEQASLSKQIQREGARAVRLVKPVYPTIARRLGHEGTVVLAIRVLDSGRVGDVTIVTSTGHRSLDQAAVRAARRSRYAPASLGGLHVNSTKRTAFTFRLEDVE